MKGLAMLVSQSPNQTGCLRQGSLQATLAELASHGAAPSARSDGLRQRLLEIAERLARVQGMGSEYARIGLSEEVQAILAQPAGVA